MRKRSEQARQKRQEEQRDKFETKFRTIISDESIDLNSFDIDDPDEQDIKNFSLKALEMLERFLSVEIFENLFDKCYEKLDKDVIITILKIEELETQLRHYKLKDY